MAILQKNLLHLKSELAVYMASSGAPVYTYIVVCGLCLHRSPGTESLVRLPRSRTLTAHSGIQRRDKFARFVVFIRHREASRQFLAHGSRYRGYSLAAGDTALVFLARQIRAVSPVERGVAPTSLVASTKLLDVEPG